MKKTVLAVPAAAALAVLGGAYGAYRYAFYSPRRAQNVDRAPVALPMAPEERRRSLELIDALDARDFERVSIRSHDGLCLRARYYHVRDGAPLCILCHGYRGTPLRDFSGGAQLCLSRGDNVLLVEQRAHCTSEGHTISLGVNERRDCLAWTHWALRRFGPDVRILLIGISMGATTVLLASALELPAAVRGIVADCPYASPAAILRKVGRDMGIPMRAGYPLLRLGARLYGGFDPDAADACEAVTHARVPILLIHGEADGFVPCAMSRGIAAAAPEKIELHTFPGAGHGLSFLADTPRYERIFTDFAARVLQ